MAEDLKNQIAGVDVGGTFTDLILVEQDTLKVRLAKVPSTLDNQAFGVLNALGEANADLRSVGLIIHGTTTTTNAVLERKLSKTGLITTRGFRDVLELGRRTRPQAYGMMGKFTPIIPRNLRLEVTERIDAGGEVVTELNEDDVRETAKALLDAGCESLVIHFLHPYANPSHELRAAEIVREIWPNDYITMGHALLSESREFERGVTASVNASVQPLLERYVKRLNGELAAGGYTGELLVMNGNGGMVSSNLVAREAAKTVMSGPASGVMAAAFTGRKAGIENLITYDMGGTSTDVALIRDAQPSVSNETEIEYAMPIHVPLVDVRTVGAGGGSIARVNVAGLLEVGPESAGANPGPICYGRGGTEPTISDANLILSRLDPEKLKSVEGGVALDEVIEIFEQKLGNPLGLSAEEAAAAVIHVANTKMAAAIRMVSISLGADPRDFSLFAFGGAGPLHAASLARELRLPQILVPCRPGITNALGCVVADLRQDFVNAVNKPLNSVDMDNVHEIFNQQMATGTAMLERQNIDLMGIAHTFSVDMQFVGQTHLLRVPLDNPVPDRETLRKKFEETYFNRFRVELAEIRANLVNINTSVVGEREELDLSSLIDPSGRMESVEEAQTGSRKVYFDEGWQETPVYWRDHLPQTFALSGPAVIEQMDTTILIEPGDQATSDKDGNILIKIGAL
ncbi:MAG: hydantoinase/oxoprolinase family protein [Stappiaceae bacterium]